MEHKEYVEYKGLPKSIAENFVLIQVPELNKTRKTKSGIFLTSGRDDSKLDGMDIYQQIDRFGTVVMTSKLRFDLTVDEGLEWKPDSCEVKKGDTVWMRQIEANTAERLKVGDKYYKLVSYDCITVIKRGKKVIPVNGWILLEPVFKVSSKLIKQPFAMPIPNQGIVKYIGKPNKDYRDNYNRNASGVYKYKNDNDEPEIKVGDKVEYELVPRMYGSKPLTPIWLEAELFPTFGETLKIAQRRHVTLIHNNNMESKPQGDVIVVKTKEQEKKTKSGLFIPENAKSVIAPPNKGLIIAVGNGSKERPMEYKEKQKIMFRPFSGYESEIEGEKYLLIKQGDVMMVLPDNEEVL